MRIEDGFKCLDTIFNGIKIEFSVSVCTMEREENKFFACVCVCDENTYDLLS